MKVEWDSEIHVFELEYSTDKAKLIVSQVRVSFLVYNKKDRDFSNCWQKQFQSLPERDKFLEGFLLGLTAFRHIKGSESLFQFLFDPS